MTFLIRNADQTLKTYTDRIDDLYLQPGEYLEISPLSFVGFSARLRLSVQGQSGERISVPAGSPQVLVEVACPAETSLTLSVNGTPLTLAVSAGHATLALAAQEPGIYFIEPADKRLFCAAGEAILCVEVTP